MPSVRGGSGAAAKTANGAEKHRPTRSERLALLLARGRESPIDLHVNAAKAEQYSEVAATAQDKSAAAILRVLAANYLELANAAESRQRVTNPPSVLPQEAPWKRTFLRSPPGCGHPRERRPHDE